jgi:hypothetical protein
MRGHASRAAAAAGPRSCHACSRRGRRAVRAAQCLAALGPGRPGLTARPVLSGLRGRRGVRGRRGCARCSGVCRPALVNAGQTRGHQGRSRSPTTRPPAAHPSGRGPMRMRMAAAGVPAGLYGGRARRGRRHHPTQQRKRTPGAAGPSVPCAPARAARSAAACDWPPAMSGPMGCARLLPQRGGGQAAAKARPGSSAALGAGGEPFSGCTQAAGLRRALRLARAPAAAWGEWIACLLLGARKRRGVGGCGMLCCQ